MTSGHNHTTDGGAEPEDAALASGLRTRADLFAIAPPPITAVRRNARKRRTRRKMVQGMSGLAACAVVAGVFAWSPRQDTGIGPTPANTGRPSPLQTSAPPSPAPSTPSPSAPSAPSAPVRTTSGSGYLLASDLGPGWTGPDPNSVPLAELDVAGSLCSTVGYKPSIPVAAAPNQRFMYWAPGKQPTSLYEAVFVFAPGTGPSVMAEARTALKTGCGHSTYIKLLASPQTSADEVIVYTAGTDTRDILVRSGDRVASAGIAVVPAGQAGTDLIATLAQQMAARLKAG